MGLIAGVSGVESCEQFEEVFGPGTEVLVRHNPKALFLFRRQLRSTGRDPDRCRFAAVGQPRPRVAERAVDKEPPKRGAMLSAPVDPAQCSAPERIVLERKCDDRADALTVS